MTQLAGYRFPNNLLADFDYVRPGNLAEALQILAQEGEGAWPLAGGTSALVDVRAGSFRPRLLVDIGKLADLRFIRAMQGTMRIGAATTLTEIEQSPLVHQDVPMLAKAARSVGGPQTRNLATIGGNIAYASPGADLAPPLLALEANVELVSHEGTRNVPLTEFFVGPRKTVRKSHEIMTHLSFPIQGSAKGAFAKLGLRKALAIALVCVGVVVETDAATNKITKARVGLGAVAPTPLRATSVERVLEGRTFNKDVSKEEVLAAASQHVHSRSSSIRSSPEYRKEIAGVLVWRALEEALSQGT